MQAEKFVAVVSENVFLDEIHHLLWIDSFKKGGITDLGWNCRDHALILAGVAFELGLGDILAVTGKAAVIRGRDTATSAPPSGLEQRLHTWLQIGGVGMFDISPNLAAVKPLRVGVGSFIGIIASKSTPPGAAGYLMTQDEAHYNATFDRATHSVNDLYALYLAKMTEPLTAEALDQAFRWCNSPLTVRLKNLKVPGTAYRLAAAHLLAVVEGRAPSLRAVPQMAAWKRLTGKTGPS